MKVSINRDECCGHGRCAALAPHVFGLDDVGYAELLIEQIPPDLEAEAREAEATCPERCITVE